MAKTEKFCILILGGEKMRIIKNKRQVLWFDYKVKKRSFVTILTSLFLFIYTSTSFALELRIGHFAPVGHPITQGTTEAAKTIKKLSGGDIVLKVFPANQLGKNKDLVQQVSDGSLDFTNDGPGMIGNWHKPVAVFEAPFLADSWSEMKKIVNSQKAQSMFKELENKASLKVISNPWNGSSRNFTTTNKAIKTPEDLKGLKIRVPKVPHFMDMIKACEGVPSPMAFAEVYMALQTGVVDGQENPITTINAGKFQEVQKHISMTGHITTAFLVLSNSKKWESLPQKQKDIIIKGFNAGAKVNDKAVNEAEKKLLKEFKAAGMTVTKPDKDAFKKKMVVVYKNKEADWGKGIVQALRSGL